MSAAAARPGDSNAIIGTVNKCRTPSPFKFSPSPPASPVGLTLPLIPQFSFENLERKSDKWSIPVFEYNPNQTSFTENKNKFNNIEVASEGKEITRSQTERIQWSDKNLLTVPASDVLPSDPESVATPCALTYRRSLSAPDNKDNGSKTGGSSLCWQSSSLKGEYKLDFIDHLVKLQESVNSRVQAPCKFPSKLQDCTGSYKELFESFCIPQSNGHSLSGLSAKAHSLSGLSAKAPTASSIESITSSPYSGSLNLPNDLELASGEVVDDLLESVVSGHRASHRKRPASEDLQGMVAIKRPHLNRM